MGTNEQKFLIDNSFDDVCLNRVNVNHHGDKRGYLYVSDIIGMYCRKKIGSRLAQLLKMNLYLISQEINLDYDTYDSARNAWIQISKVVAAESSEEARDIHPRG